MCRGHRVPSSYAAEHNWTLPTAERMVTGAFLS
jgi:hypothetical protein